MQRNRSPHWLWALLLVPLWPAAARAVDAVDVEPTRGVNLTIRPLTHAAVLLQWRGKVVYADPVGNQEWGKLPKADLIVITHEHGDHCSPETVAKIRKSDTRIVANAECAKHFPGAVVMRNGDHRLVESVGIVAVPAYNMVRKGPNGQFFHPKGRDNGYVLTFADKRVYLAGDTEAIPEMARLQHIDVAFLPINLPYTMPPAEAAKAARMFKPRILYPYHQGQSNPAELKSLLADLKGTEVRVRSLP
jgi:L-ascorbate metabolism protein UlaG (beta-lactamase superfamily)